MNDINVRDKIDKLVDIEGFIDDMEMFESATFESIAPGICMNDKCDYTTYVEPDQSEGFCEICSSNTVKSCLILGGLI